MAFNNKRLSIVNDDPCEGKPFEFPQCTTCLHCENTFCKAFNKERLEVIVDNIADVFNCPNFKSKY